MPEQGNLPYSENIDDQNSSREQCFICGGGHPTDSHVDSLVEEERRESLKAETGLDDEESQEKIRVEQEKLENMKRYLAGLSGDKTAAPTIQGDTLMMRAKFTWKKSIDSALRGAFFSLDGNVSFKNVSIQGREIQAELAHPIGDITKILISYGKVGM